MKFLSTSIDPERFVAAVQPLLERRDQAGLLKLLRAKWTAADIVGLLSCKCDDARKVAALALALVGGKCCVDELARQLKDSDPMVNQMAEHALWSIWFRCGCPEANHELCRGTEALNRKDFEAAMHHFTTAAELSPDFAEAYNQRAIASYLMERWEDSIRDCQRTVELMPVHFGAWAGIGHCQAHLGNLKEAVRSYQRALQLNPHLDCVRQAVRELRQRLGQMG